MNIGIIVHSKTGNTYTVAQKLEEKLISIGHTVSLQRLIPVDDKVKEVKKIQFKTTPDITSYDALIFAAPVQGFAISSVLAAYLATVESLKNKKVACFVTELFPFPWMGGNQAIGEMKKICQVKGGAISGTGIIHWKRASRENKINELVQNLSGLF